jgi:hypothetical protein
MGVRVQSLAQEAWQQHEIQKRLRSTICRNYLEELAYRVRRESLQVVDDLARRFEPDCIDPRQAGEELFDCIMRVLSAAEANRQVPDADVSPRAVISRKLRDGLLQELEGESRGRVRLTMRCSVAEVRARAQAARVADVVISSAAELVSQKLRASASDASLTGGLCRWVAQAIEVGIASKDELRDLVRARRAIEVTESRPALDTETSRFTAERLLLMSDTVSDSSVLNVFALDGDALCPVVLHILYTLRFRGAADVTRKHLVQSLAFQGFQPEEILAGLSAVMRLSRRLIYSGIDDHIVSIDRWTEEPGRVVRLASAGAGYLDKLLKVPSYMQWALELRSIRNQPGRKRSGDNARSVRGRLWMARGGFDAAMEYERSRLERVWKGRQQLVRSMDPNAQAPVADIFFAVLDSFMHVYRVNHTVHMSIGSGSPDGRARRMDALGLAQDARAWVDLAEDAYGKLQGYLAGVPVEAWQRAIAQARKDITAMRGA